MALRWALPVLLGLAAAAPATETADRLGTPPRLSLIEGEVSFWRPGAEEWAPARLNTALAPGDVLYAGAGANTELQIGGRAFVRAGSGTELTLVGQEPDFLQLKVTAGSVAMDVRQIGTGHLIEIATPHGAFTIERAGYYRVDVGQSETAFTVRRGGQGTLVVLTGAATTVTGNEQIVSGERVTVRPAPDTDTWDRWNYVRTDEVFGEERSYYLPPDIYGREDLNRYGHWRLVPTYGRVWVPRHVAPGWAPYTTGRWMWDPYYHWTWVDDAPWGWAPFHYGRWVYYDDCWAWAPGPVVGVSVYAPALVAFFDVGPDVVVGFSTPGVAWVALGWGEPIIPWWGSRGYIGVPHWHGWHGPHVVNHEHIHQTTIIHADRVTIYENAKIRHAVVGAPRDRFFRHDGDRRRIETRSGRRLDPFRGALPVRPTAAGVVGGDERARRPPEAFHGRQVVVTRPARDATESLRAAGLTVPPRSEAPAPRVVERSPFGRRLAEREAPRSVRPETGRSRVGEPRREPERGPAEPRARPFSAPPPRERVERAPEAPAFGGRREAPAEPRTRPFSAPPPRERMEPAPESPPFGGQREEPVAPPSRPFAAPPRSERFEREAAPLPRAPEPERMRAPERPAFQPHVGSPRRGDADAPPMGSEPQAAPRMERRGRGFGH